MQGSHRKSEKQRCVVALQRAGGIGRAAVLCFALAGLAVAQPPGQPVSGPAPSPAVAETQAGAKPSTVTIRVATFNIEDVSTLDVLRSDQPRLKHLASVIASIRPNIILLNEIAYDSPGAPSVPAGEPPGRNGERFVTSYLSHYPDLPRYKAYMPPVNTGISSGFDLDNDGKVVSAYLEPAAANSDGTPAPQTEAGRAYGNDCYGFGTYPGQYGFALLVDERLTISPESIRTFQRYPWSYLPGAFLPRKPSAGTGSEVTPGEHWYSEEERKYLRLSSKTFADIPVTMPNGAVLHLLCSHPTPPAFDGAEQRNQRRNHDELRLVADYIQDAAHLVDDAGKEGGLGRFEQFVILGDLNADPKDGSSFKDPMQRFFMRNRKVNFRFTPESPLAVAGLDATDTASFKLRVDYVLPSIGVTVVRGGVHREVPAGASRFPSDHYPVYLDLAVPPPVLMDDTK